MKLDKKLFDLTKKYLINPSIKFTYPITAIANNSKSCIAFLDLSSIEPFETFAVYKSDILCQMVDMIDGEVELNGEDIIISNEYTKQKIRTIVPDLIPHIKIESLKMVEGSFEIINTVKIDEILLKDILQRTKIMGHNVFIIEKDKIITAFQNGSELQDESETKIETENDGTIKLNIEDIYKIPVQDYIIKVFQNDDIKLAIFYSIDDPVKIIISEKLD